MCECNKAKEDAYNKMVDRVAESNAKAAEWLRDEAVKLDSFSYDGDLWECFIWADTPQGNHYWFNIANVIESDGETP